MQFFNKVLRKLIKNQNNIIFCNIRTFILISIIILLQFDNLRGQQTWHFIDGNLSGSKRTTSGFELQQVPSFTVKWQTPYIKGDVTPLIGNIVQNSIDGISVTEPLEICALMGDEIVLLSGTGKLIKKQKLPEYARHIRSFTALFDSNHTAFDGIVRNTCLIASESMEYHNPEIKENLAHSYIFAYDSEYDSIKIVRRLTIDLKDYGPNISASIKPFYGRRVNGKLMVYAIVDMMKPLLDPNRPNKRYPFFRGYTQFYDNVPASFFPMPDMGDSAKYRIHFTGDVGLYQPSVIPIANNLTSVLLPYQQIDTLTRKSLKNFIIRENIAGADYQTNADSTYLAGFNITNDGIIGNFSPRVFNTNGKRPIIRPIYAKLSNYNQSGGIITNNYVIVSEQYSGIEGSTGTSKLHLYTTGGAPLTSTNLSLNIPPFVGGENHYWSVAVGDVDGLRSSNHWAPYYPNNPGNEIIVTQSSKEATYPGSKLFVLKYNNGDIKKPIPPYNNLYQFDTICTSRVNGWLAAVADLDLADDKKDEIVLVDGSKLMILQLRDYNSIDFRTGYPFDTLYVKDFSKQTISNVAISDLEGDGKPEIIVTTHDSTYIIGSKIPNTLIVDAPNINTNTSYCLNDTIEIKWHNKILNQERVAIKFERYDASGNIIDVIDLDTNVFNYNDSLNYKILADRRFFQGINEKNIVGKFIVSGLDESESLSDTSQFININKPNLRISSVIPSELSVSDEINIIADVECIEKVEINFSANNSNDWHKITTIPVEKDNISFTFTVPCLENVFDCNDNNPNTNTINFQFVTYVNGVNDTSYINNIIIKPKKINLAIEPKQSANPSLVVIWNPNELLSLNSNGKVNILVSRNSGYSFDKISESNISSGRFVWEIPCDIPNTILLRLCVDNGCYSLDTLITDVAAKYVNIIAPNPFNPNIDNMEFVYQVPEDMLVTINIYDQSNRLVRNLIKEVPKKSCTIYTETWDGLMNNGNMASNGLYYLITEFSNGNREIYQLFLAK